MESDEIKEELLMHIYTRRDLLRGKLAGTIDWENSEEGRNWLKFLNGVDRPKLSNFLNERGMFIIPQMFISKLVLTHEYSVLGQLAEKVNNIEHG